MGKVEAYIIGLCVEVLGEQPDTKKSFDWARGDSGRSLPFDGVWRERRLIVEVDEDQHRGQRVGLWDDKPTVSGVTRGTQRPMYDQRKRSAARKHGYRVVEIPWVGKRSVAGRDRDADRDWVRGLLADA